MSEDDTQSEEVNTKNVQQVQDVTSDSRKPSKRRKVASTVPEENVTTNNDGLDNADSPLDPNHYPTLPIFPPPAIPNAPSKSTLALQGLDKALIDAEFIDPDVTRPIPLDETGDNSTHLSEKMRRRLHGLGITELFAVQTALLPFLIPSSDVQHQLYLSTRPPRDVCISAPTGSGKTLAYALPIVEILSSRVLTQLRALIILPTRDLVAQVRETFEVLGKGRGLKIGTATGQHSFAHEQSQLVNDQTSSLLGGSSRVDILICTPGRLIDHMNGTPNFTLQHLRFLVIDEADRLLAQSFQDWLAQVLAALRPHRTPNCVPGTQVDSIPHPDTVAPYLLHRLPYPHYPTFLTEVHESSCQKLLFSATLTRDPGKIASLELREPKYFIVQKSRESDGQDRILSVVMEKFSIPSTLKHMLVCESSQKPLMFFHLVFHLNVTDALVFTKSSESTARLVRLFDFFQKWRTAESGKSLVVQAYSSDLSVGERKVILERFKAQEINILICSDLISRGIDISHVSHVVSYDVPVDMRKYVHRVGRTARAGRSGDAWALVEEQEARYFKNMLRDADHLNKVGRLRVNEGDIEKLAPGYEVAIKQLRDVYTHSS
ncbi:hypothetical protein AGABI2DRAFT_201250 [Agaricus bisporus var. bisporus H97]|uniref:hypothetical protein n=1 Tax=Agaricus bisporus var. bisporus (strain H97 / ATCC MYA-4626 / FGSC 10389) TaxID=936046 RepID=UPI00029F6768|nr:hypothetical protein AGABI2DRAFT_201250 [Agaricus bisporus var. bisporus H97]EKV49153.1 hypothetical protein AGABI2DRAFT_201250 [Agaricus bisporus var. bisporus H97]